MINILSNDWLLHIGIFINGHVGVFNSNIILFVRFVGLNNYYQFYTQYTVYKQKKQHIIADNKGKKIKVCALTGCAAILLKCKATTLHSFAGIGLANKSIEQVVRSVLDNKQKHKKQCWCTHT